MDELHRKVDRLIQNKKSKRWHYLLLCIVMISFGSVLALPFFDDKSLLSHVQTYLESKENKNIPDVGDEPLNGSAYNYWYAPPNSFGINQTKTVNFTFWKQWLKKYFSYELEARQNNESAWQNANELLNVSLLFNETNNTCKITLTLNTSAAPTSLYYRFTLIANRSVISHVNKSVNYQYTLNLSANTTENYSLVYNYSDLAPYIQSGVITIKQGIWNNYFYQRIRTNKRIAVNRTVVIDPWFGTQDITGTSTEIDDRIRGYCANNQLSPLAYATADNITFRIRNTNAGTEVARYALYYASNKTFIAETNEITLAANMGSFDWYTGTLPANTYIYSDRTYMMVANGNNNVFVRYVDPLNGFNAWRDDYNYGSWPDPTVATANVSDRGIRCYLSYTNVSEDGKSWQSNYSGYFTGGNISTWTQNYSGYFTGGNDTVTWTQNYTGYFTGGNATVSWQQNFSGYWIGGNVSNYSPEQSNMYPCSTNVSVQPTLSVLINDTEGDTMNQSFWSNYTSSWVALDWNNNTGNASLQYSFVEANIMGITYWWSSNTTDGVNWVNDSCSFITDIEKTWQSNFSGFWTGGNDTVSWNQNFTGWWSGGNDSISWQQNFSGYWTGGHIANWTQNFSGYWTGGNVSETWQQNFSGYWTGGNVSVVFNITDEYPVNLSNIYRDQPTIYFTLTHPTGGKLLNYSLYIGNSSANCTTLLFNGTNVSSGEQIDSSHLYYSCTEFYIDYFYSIHANDGTNWVNKTYNFQAILQGTMIDSGAGFAVGIAMAAAMLAIGFVLVVMRRQEEK